MRGPISTLHGVVFAILGPGSLHDGRGSPDDPDARPAPPPPPNVECKPAKRLPAKEAGSIGRRTPSGKTHPKGSAGPWSPDWRLNLRSVRSTRGAGAQEDSMPGAPCPQTPAAIGEPRSLTITAFGTADEDRRRPAPAFTLRWQISWPAERGMFFLAITDRPQSFLEG